MGYDAVVVGSGPNGLSAAVTLAEAGLSVCVLEKCATAGGGARTAELTLPGCRHDVCSAVHPLGVGSPFFRRLPLTRYGLRWIHPPIPMAHPFDDGTAAALFNDIDQTAATLGEDGPAYTRSLLPIVRAWDKIEDQVLGPFSVPRHPFEMARFGLIALQSAAGFARRRFRGEKGRGLWAGLAAHSMLPLDSLVTSAVPVVLAVLAHRVGWPFPESGAGRLSEALVSYLVSLGGEVRTSHPVSHLADLPPSRVVLLDLSPKPVLELAGAEFRESYRRQLQRYQYGVGVFKLDLVIEGRIPFRAAECGDAGTVHLGGSLREIAEAERTAWEGRHSAKPFVLLSQPSRFDRTRAPEGLETIWTYCHVPAGSNQDMTEAIENQIERFAPGFRRQIRARSAMTAEDFERYNPSYIGGDINGGVQNWRQIYARPALKFCPYATSDPSLFICSSSTPPGGGVHGMCGYHAARAVLSRVFKKAALG
ncbi:MAG: NAD(P)/FAD-dependent oxidoreductase [Acidobacteria bacterium]|nr:MAG: NAD(P)/FAD-dependent oxidoreductase [Acidobacteriota bacterium]